MRFYKMIMGTLGLTSPPAPSSCNGEGETDSDQVPSPRVETYAPHTRDYRSEVNQVTLPDLMVKEHYYAPT